MTSCKRLLVCVFWDAWIWI